MTTFFLALLAAPLADQAVKIARLFNLADVALTAGAMGPSSSS